MPDINKAAPPAVPAGPPGPFGAGEPAEPVVLDRRTGPHGEIVLRRHGELLQIIANGTFLMDTSDGRSERLLVRAALAELDATARAAAPADAPADEAGPPPGPSVLIGGLGVGYSLAEAAAEPRWSRITVVEREEAVIDWHGPHAPLSGLTAQALGDARTEVVHADLMAYLKDGLRDGLRDGPKDGLKDGRTAGVRFDALCLDIDNGPDWTVTDDNGSLYSPSGLAACAARLAPGGVLAVWSANPSRTFADALADAGFERVSTEEISVVRGVPDVVHFATKPA